MFTKQKQNLQTQQVYRHSKFTDTASLQTRYVYKTKQNKTYKHDILQT